MGNLWQPTDLPLEKDIETLGVLKKLSGTHRALAELKGLVSGLPNPNLFLNTLGLQEAKDSSAVENIITTHDELYKAELDLSKVNSVAAKEVRNYVSALKRGFSLVSEEGLFLNKHIRLIQEELENNSAGFRTVPGTSLKNQATGEVVYTPPQDPGIILSLMANLEEYINDNELSQLDPLVKMAVIHFQFESIHPFYDGNGRTGRIINILYLVLNKLLNYPILYLSRYINHNKANYYKFIQGVRDEGVWDNWVMFMLDAVEKTSKQTIQIISEMKTLMQDYKVRIRNEYKFYSQDLLNNLFKHPYTKIEILQNDLGVSRITAASYLNQLSEGGFLSKNKLGNTNYYINVPLFDLLENQPSLRTDAL